ncbi:hypothetical protein ABW20_dc0108863 [Dactylellina cionopaga]|nr:hypothetical protein ABW20_dc0108863 [Dactylellina cionopaga]
MPPATFVASMALQEVTPPDINKITSANDSINDAGSNSRRRVFKSTSVTSHFLIGGKPKLPLIYTVETLREGKTYRTRHVQVRQPSPEQQQRPLDADVIFAATVSFKTAEPQGLESQVPPPKELKNWVANPKQWGITPTVDVPSWIEYAKQKGINPYYTAVDLRKVEVDEENKTRPLHKHRKAGGLILSGRRVMYEHMYPYRTYLAIGEYFLHIPVESIQYASDRNGMFAVTGPHNQSDNIIHTGSLSHTVVFHANPSKLLFNTNNVNEESPSSWAILEQFGDSASEGRGLMRARIWSADGTLLASAMQDALIRVRVGDNDNEWPRKIDRRKMTFSEQLKSVL